MIRFSSVTKKYAGTSRPALNGVDFEILRGEFVFLVGASGSGKSSCLRLMIKEDKPNSGSIHVLGQDLGAISNRKIPYFRRNLGVVFQDFRLLPNKTVYENVAFTLQVIGKSRGFIQEAVPDVLKMVGLAGKSHRYPHELSGGEQQRVAIARAIVNKPALLLADEPTGNLDPATSAGIMALLERINEGGTTIVMATHAADFVDRMQKRVIELVAGQIVRDEREAGYGKTAALPVVGADVSVNSTGDLSAVATAALAQKGAQAGSSTSTSSKTAKTSKTGPVEPIAEIVETTDIVVENFYPPVDEATLDGVPKLHSAFDGEEDEDLGSLEGLFLMNDSQAVPRLSKKGQISDDVDVNVASAGETGAVLDENSAEFKALPLKERMRLQAQARGKATDGDQNVGPVS